MNTDKAIQLPVDDELENKHFAFYLAKGLFSLKKTTDSFVIGICGVWGEGKTSAINMALQYLKSLYQKNTDSINEAEELIDNIKFQKRGINVNSFNNWLSIFILLLTIVNKWEMFLFFILLSFQSFLTVIFIMIFMFLVLKKTIFFITNIFHQKSNQSFITIHFNPWNYTNSERILEAFFRIVAKELSQTNDKCISKVSKLISAYAKIAHNIDLTKLENLFNKESESDLKEKINEALEKSNKKIIVVIDDIDRLLPEEILLIFKTVKIIADFPNTIYLLAYDKLNIENELKEFKFIGKDYIKKIVQVEKNLPLANTDILKNKFMDQITKIEEGPYKNNPLIEEMYDYALSKYIQNLRDFHRFFNTFEFVHSAYRNEDINIMELMGITAIEVFEPNLYKYIRENRDIFCAKGFNISISELPVIFSINSSTIDIKAFVQSLLEYENIELLAILFPMFFNNLKIKNKKIVDKNKADNSYKILENINEKIPELKNFIVRNEYSANNEETYRSISNVLYFNNYFKVNIEKTALLSAEKKKLLNNFNSSEEFVNLAYKLFTTNCDKIIDFFNFWISKYNDPLRTKEMTLQLLNNLLAFNNNHKSLIEFLEQSNIFSSMARNLIRDFNEQNSNNLVSIIEVLELLKNNIKNINNNLYFFIYVACWQFKFPTNNPPELNEIENESYARCIELFNNNILLEGLVNSNDALQCIDYLIDYFDQSDLIADFIDELFRYGNEEKLCKILLTGEKMQSRLNNIGNIPVVFDKIHKKQALKLKLLDIYYKDTYSSMLNDGEFLSNDEYDGEDASIVKIVLKYLVADLGKVTRKDEFKSISNIDEYEIVLKLMKETYEACSVAEINFIKETTQIDIKNRVNNIMKEIKNKIEQEYPVMYDLYKSIIDKFID